MGIKLIGKNTWCIDVHIYGKGRRQRTIHGTKDLAREVEWEIRNELRTGFIPGRSLTENHFKTFGEVLRFYLDKKNGGRCR